MAARPAVLGVLVDGGTHAVAVEVARRGALERPTFAAYAWRVRAFVAARAAVVGVDVGVRLHAAAAVGALLADPVQAGLAGGTRALATAAVLVVAEEVDARGATDVG